MPYRGHVGNGVIVLDESAPFEEGAKVQVDLAAEATDTGDDSGPSFTQRFAEVMGKAQSLPEDAAENHDHYLYGVPKR